MDISSTTHLTFQGDVSKVERCTLSTGGDVFRKTGAPAAIAREINALQNLVNSSRIVKTPQLLASGDNWLATAWLEGKNLAELFSAATSEPERIAICERFGSLLCASTAISSRTPESESTFDMVFDTLEAAVHAGADRVICDPDSFIDGHAIGDVWRDVIADAGSLVPEIRYCQGDWCLPNVMMRGNDSMELGAIVDWSEAGWMDWRFCLADGLWSIGYNSRLAGVDPSVFRMAFLNACDVNENSIEVTWHRKLRALMSII
jgi:aminoglycoside phosphotransferase